jgi:hypothetical protein
VLYRGVCGCSGIQVRGEHRVALSNLDEKVAELVFLQSVAKKRKYLFLCAVRVGAASQFQKLLSDVHIFYLFVLQIYGQNIYQQNV